MQTWWVVHAEVQVQLAWEEVAKPFIERHSGHFSQGERPLYAPCEGGLACGA